MSLINLSVKHGQTVDEARKRLEASVDQVRAKFGAMISRTEWSPDRNKVTLAGTGFDIQIWIDSLEVHLKGDLPFLGALLGSPVVQGLKGVLENTFQKRLT